MLRREGEATGTTWHTRQRPHVTVLPKSPGYPYARSKQAGPQLGDRPVRTLWRPRVAPKVQNHQLHRNSSKLSRTAFSQPGPLLGCCTASSIVPQPPGILRGVSQSKPAITWSRFCRAQVGGGVCFPRCWTTDVTTPDNWLCTQGLNGRPSPAEGSRRLWALPPCRQPPEDPGGAHAPLPRPFRELQPQPHNLQPGSFASQRCAMAKKSFCAL